MKNFVIALSVFLAVSTLATAQTSTKPSKEEVQKTTYACPMHPKEMGKQEDKCSKCGMALTKIETPKPTYACPMHPKEMGKQEDKCSKCGMALTKVEEDKNK
jgi:ribosomal protein S14